MSDEISKKQMIDLLVVEINKAVLESPNVKKLLMVFHELGLVEQVRHFDLVFDVEMMVKRMFDPKPMEPTGPKGMEGDDVDPEFSNPGQTNQKEEQSIDHSCQVDGKDFSANEVLFQKYADARFDEKNWLKKLKIRY